MLLMNLIMYSHMLLMNINNINLAYVLLVKVIVYVHINIMATAEPHYQPSKKQQLEKGDN